MFIQTEQTPNPATIKFLPGQTVLAHGTATFQDIEQTDSSPLAKRLLGIDGIASIFFSGDFISVTKQPDAEWSLLKTHVLAEIMQHFTSGLPVMQDAGEAHGGAHISNDDDSEIVKQIREILDTRVRPAVAQDGGDISFVRFDDGIVYLRMHGACAGCPSSTATLKMGVENLLKHYVPEVVAVAPAEEIGY